MSSTSSTATGEMVAGGTTAGLRLASAATASVSCCIVIAATAWSTDTRLGAPQAWPWALTGLQVLSLWAAGTERWWGWLLGASVQPPWIAYAVLTGQLGFIPGCAVSAAVQTYSFLHGAPGTGPMRRLARHETNVERPAR